MQILHLLRLLDETTLSPEQFGALLDISGMTLRRWRAQRPSSEVPKFYQKLVIDLIPQLVDMGLLPHDSPALKTVIRMSGQDGLETMARSVRFETIFIDGAMVAQEKAKSSGFRKKAKDLTKKT